MMPPKVLLSGTVSKIISYMASSTDSWGLTKRKIAKGAGISEVHLHRVWPVLERYSLVEPTRKVGPATLYVVNKESPIIWFYLHLLDEIEKADAELTTGKVKHATPSKRATRFWKARARVELRRWLASAKKLGKRLFFR